MRQVLTFHSHRFFALAGPRFKLAAIAEHSNQVCHRLDFWEVNLDEAVAPGWRDDAEGDLHRFSASPHSALYKTPCEVLGPVLEKFLNDAGHTVL